MKKKNAAKELPGMNYAVDVHRVVGIARQQIAAFRAEGDVREVWIEWGRTVRIVDLTLCVRIASRGA
jgi:hypothetical protein